MARTHVPNFIPLPIKEGIDLDDFKAHLQEVLSEVMGDEDKAGSIDDAAFYEGQAHVILGMLCIFTGVERCDTCGIAKMPNEEWHHRNAHCKEEPTTKE